MSWRTIYITGREDFRDDVRSKLEHAAISSMPGYIEDSGQTGAHDLYWLDGRTSLRKFKEAIGGKLIWKYRLRFFSSLESFLKSQEAKTENIYSERERQMMQEMRRSA